MMDKSKLQTKSAIQVTKAGLLAALMLCNSATFASIIATSEADVLITLTSAQSNGVDVTDISGLDLSLSFFSQENISLIGDATGSATANSTLTASDPSRLAFGDSMHVVSQATGTADNGGHFAIESDGSWVFSVTNQGDFLPSLRVRFDLSYLLNTDFFADNPATGGSGPSTGGVGVGGVGVGGVGVGSVGAGGAGGATPGPGGSPSSSNSDSASAQGYLARQNVSGAGGVSGTPPPHAVRNGTLGTFGYPANINPGSRQVFFNLINLGVNDTQSFTGEPVFVSVVGTAATSIPEPPITLLILAGLLPLFSRQLSLSNKRSAPPNSRSDSP